MNTIQSSIYGAKLLIALLINQNPEIEVNSTINERLDISGDLRPADNERVYLGTLVVGNRGHSAQVGDGGIPLISVLDHFATDASVFNPIPFCIRPISNDLTEIERRKYCLRKEITIGEETYYAYYGLRLAITPDQAVIKMKKITNNNGVITEEIFVPTSDNLYPDPVVLSDSEAISTTNVSYSASVVIRIELDATDIEEYVNAAKIIYGGDERYAIMSEFSLCTGADRMMTVPSTLGNINFLESIATQVYSFNADYKALYYNSQELTLDFDLGNQIPMLSTVQLPVVE